MRPSIASAPRRTKGKRTATLYLMSTTTLILLKPIEWAQEAIRAYRTHRADRIVAEINQGGDLVENTLRMVDANVAFKAVHASHGKVIRAEPVSALCEQGEVHHVGSFPALEDQMCSFTADYERSKGNSPDRLDALVWALSELMVEAMSGWGPTSYDSGVIIPNAQKAPAAGELARVKAPPSLQASTIYTITGRSLMLPPDRTLEVGEEDAKALIRNEWTRVVKPAPAQVDAAA